MRASEERYRSLSETLPAMVTIVAPDGHVTFVNRRWADYTGLDLEQINAGSLEAVAHAEDIERLRAAWEKSRLTGIPIELDYRVRRADGAYRWHFSRALPIRDAYGRITRWLATTTDIDDRKRAEEAQEFLADATALLASSLNYEAALRNLVGLVVPRVADIAAIDVFEADGAVRRIASRALDDVKQRLLDEIHVRDWPVGNGRDQRVVDVLLAGRSIFFADVSAWRERLADYVDTTEAREFGAKSIVKRDDLGVAVSGLAGIDLERQQLFGVEPQR